MSMHCNLSTLMGKIVSQFKMYISRRDCREIRFQTYITIKLHALIMIQSRNYVSYLRCSLDELFEICITADKNNAD